MGWRRRAVALPILLDKGDTLRQTKPKRRPSSPAATKGTGVRQVRTPQPHVLPGRRYIVHGTSAQPSQQPNFWNPPAAEPHYQTRSWSTPRCAHWLRSAPSTDTKLLVRFRSFNGIRMILTIGIQAGKSLHCAKEPTNRLARMTAAIGRMTDPGIKVGASPMETFPRPGG